jgi:hypothetical protein
MSSGRSAAEFVRLVVAIALGGLDPQPVDDAVRGLCSPRTRG